MKQNFQLSKRYNSLISLIVVLSSIQLKDREKRNAKDYSLENVYRSHTFGEDISRILENILQLEYMERFQLILDIERFYYSIFWLWSHITLEEIILNALINFISCFICFNHLNWISYMKVIYYNDILFY